MSQLANTVTARNQSIEEDHLHAFYFTYTVTVAEHLYIYIYKTDH